MSRLGIALAVSIIVNLFLAGALAAGYVSLRTGQRMIAAGSLRVAGTELPKDERRAFRAALRQARHSVHPIILDARAARIEAAGLLRAPVVDQAAVLTALARARSDDMAVRTTVEQRAVSFAVGLPPASRARLADAMERRAAR